ncbi:MAG: hypothetical protein IPH55_19770 [Betaproteobacteria bacterium]|nr:hypothetical protein [Betaproteobacteria bacterium]
MSKTAPMALYNLEEKTRLQPEKDSTRVIRTGIRERGQPATGALILTVDAREQRRPEGTEQWGRHA